MKRLQTLMAMLIAVCLCAGLTSCEKDGVYNPKKKISTIYYAPNGGSKQISERWTWEGNKLKKIEYPSSGEYDLFTYDGKRVSKMERIGGSSSQIYEYSYDGSKLAKIKSIYNGRMDRSGYSNTARTRWL